MLSCRVCCSFPAEPPSLGRAQLPLPLWHLHALSCLHSIVTISPLASVNDDAHWRVGDSMGLSETSSPKPRSPVTQLGDLRHTTSSGQGHPISQKAGVIGWPSEDSWRVSNAATQAGCLACANHSINNTYFYSHLGICVHCSSS